MRKLIISSLISLCVVILAVVIISTSSIDNVKQYNEQTEEVIITDVFGFGNDIAEMKLNKGEEHRYIFPHDTSWENYAFELEVEFKQDLEVTWINDMEYYNKDKPDGTITDTLEGRGFLYRVYDEKYKWNESSNILTCSDNKTCQLEPYNITHTGGWKEFSPDALVSKGNITIRGYFDVEASETVEWIPTFFDVRIPEWDDFSGYTLYEEQNGSEDDAGFPSSSGTVREVFNQFVVGNVGANVTITPHGASYNFKAKAGGSVEYNFYILGYNNASNEPNESDIICERKHDSTGNFTQNAWNNLAWFDCYGTLNPGGVYFVGINTSDGDASNNLQWSQDASSPADGGRRYHKVNGAWVNTTSVSYNYQIWGTAGASNNAPTVTADTPINNTNSSSNDITFGCTGNDTDGGLYNLSVRIDGAVNYTAVNSSANENLTFDQQIDNFADGSYLWDCYADDGSDTNSTAERNITVDTKPPQLTIGFPTNTTYSANVTELNYTANDTTLSSESCLYTRDAGATNSSLVASGTNFTGITSIEGTNNWVLWCNDTVDNWNSSSISFVKDTVAPRFTTFANQSIFENSSLAYNINAVDDTVGVDNFTINDTTEFNINQTGYLSNTTNLTVGNLYQLNVTVNDTQNNLNSSVINILFKTNKTVYDEINDSILNYTLFKNSTVGTVTSFLENTDFIEINVTGDTEAYSSIELKTDNLPVISLIEELEFKVSLYAQHQAGSTTNESRAEVSVFGNVIKSVVADDSSETNYSTAIITVKRNSSLGAYNFTVYENKTDLDQQIWSSSSNVVLINVSREHEDGDVVLIADADLYYFYYIEGSGASTTTLNSPADDKIQTNRSVIFNASSSTVGNELENITLYINGAMNGSTVSISGTTNTTTFSRTLNIGSYNWTALTCNNASSCAWASSNRTINISDLQINDESYPNSSIEGSTESFRVNLTTAGGRLTTANLIFNYTSNAGTIIDRGGNNYSAVVNVTMPFVTSIANKSFYWNLILEDGNTTNGTSRNMTVTNINIDDCSSYGVLLLNYSLRDEGNQSILNGTYYNSSVEVDLDIYPVSSTTALIEYSQNYSKNNNPQVCLEADLGNSTFRLDVQTIYGGDGYSEEYYHIQNFSLVNSSLPQNIILYDLKDSDAQEFKIIFKDATFLPVSDVLIQVQRKYINEGVFKTVEIPRTDSNGETPVHLKLNDAIYTFVAVKYGETLGTFSNMRAVCQNPTLETCEIPLNVFASSITLDDYTVEDDFTFTLTYDTSTRALSSVYSIPSGTASTVTLNATLFDMIGETQACADTLTSSSGTLTCTIPQNLGNGTVAVSVIKDGSLVTQAFIPLDIEPEDLYGASIVFLGLFLILTVVGIGLTDNPMLMGIFVIIGAILLLGLNLIDTGAGSRFIGAGATVLWLIIAVVIILIKGARRT